MQKEEMLFILAKKISKCQKCKELASQRTQTVFGEGNADADIVFLGEAPGSDEDKQGVPFVGRSGKLLSNILQACGIKRQEIYILNILKCRPPSNRNPLPQEVDNCQSFLKLQLNIIDPKYIICLGTVAAQNLLGLKTSIGMLRGQWRKHPSYSAKILCTYHPAFLLRNPSAKKDVWKDMNMLIGDIQKISPTGFTV